MMRWFELTIFGGIALMGHIALFASWPDDGASTGGTGGEAQTSISAAAATVRAMVEEWERPQTTAQVDVESSVTPDVTPIEAPQMPQLQEIAAPRAAVRIALEQPRDVPAQDIVVDAPPPPPPPPPEEEPKPQPEHQVKPEPAPTPVPREAQVAKEDNAGRNARKAAGGGGGRTAGTGRTNQTSTSNDGQQQKLAAVWGEKVNARLNRALRHPTGVKGLFRVKLLLQIDRSGRLMNYRIISSSGNARIDKAGLDTVARAKRFAKAPRGFEGQSYTFTQTLAFSQ